MDALFLHAGHSVYVWTTRIAHARFIWTYTIDDDIVMACNGDFADASAALESGERAARAHADLLSRVDGPRL